MSFLRKALLTTLEAYVRDEIRKALRRAGQSQEQVERYLAAREEAHEVPPPPPEP